MTLPVALSGTDVIGQAKTGTGKTLGFGLPLLERVTVPADVEAGRAAPDSVTDAPQALIVVPTRELCQQVTNDLLTAGKVRNVRVTAIYGGRAYEPQVEALRKGVDVVVGTPGRLLDLAGQKKLDLKHVRCLVLDEADEMLDLGFLPDVEKIINMLPAKRQTMLFSATMPGAVIGLARRYMSQPTHIRATAPDDEGATVANISQHVYRAHNMDKPELVARILQAEGRGLAMVFCRTKRTAADLADQLGQRGFASGAVHGDLGQGAREQALRAFRNGKVDVLVCTDVAARGIDVEGVTHVINYQTPEDEKTYLHRIGRTGRAGASGTAITLVDWDDIPRWQLINKALELSFNDPPETYSTSPHLFAELSIPAGTKGVLPRSERTRAGLAAEELEDLGEPGGRGPRGRGGRNDSRNDRPARSDRSGRPDRSDRSDRADRADRAEHSDRERPARTPRRRRRTRGGTALESGPVQETAGTPVTPAGPPAVAPVAEDESAARTPRRRRRTRGVAQATAVSEPSSVTPADSPAALVEAEQPVTPVAEPEQVQADLEPAPAKPRRRRTRKAAEPAEPIETAAVTEAVTAPEAPVLPTPEAVVPDAVEPKPRRRTRKTAEAVEPAAEVAVDTAEGAEVIKPKRATTRKTAAKKATTAEPEVTTEAAAEVKPKRAPRKKATAAEVAVDTAEAVEVKPKRAPRKKAAAAPVAEEAPVTAEAAVVKPKRAPRKKATAAEVVVDTAEGSEATKPKRTTTRKTAAKKATTAEPEVTTEVKPKRTTRKKATAAEVTVDTAEAAEAKPKRAPRKKAAAAIPAQATAGEAETAAEPKPRVRRTRKATVAAEPTDG
ncbi:DEAD/DEAH box helicase [Streptomyces sp. NPDC004610]|uniref:DEAD/DEAH box helicase n=1 Tax=unclassified Streptomyces TaxID=2593676 RepID=UPI0033B48CD0